MNYEKIIIVDFDDTLCLHGENRSDIKNGKPNFELIKKLNELSDSGYDIHIYTARGHLSTKTRADADIKYRGTIEKWLEINNVKYKLLNFNKPFGIAYIDDKAIRPDEINILNKFVG